MSEYELEKETIPYYIRLIVISTNEQLENE